MMRIKKEKDGGIFVQVQSSRPSGFSQWEGCFVWFNTRLTHIIAGRHYFAIITHFSKKKKKTRNESHKKTHHKSAKTNTCNLAKLYLVRDLPASFDNQWYHKSLDIYPVCFSSPFSCLQYLNCITSERVLRLCFYTRWPKFDTKPCLSWKCFKCCPLTSLRFACVSFV